MSRVNFITYFLGESFCFLLICGDVLSLNSLLLQPSCLYLSDAKIWTSRKSLEFLFARSLWFHWGVATPYIEVTDNLMSSLR